MSTFTENYSLVKPGYGDQADIDVLNRLMTDKVDALLFENRRISADEYDPERQEPYKVGKLAIFENVLYKCLETTTGNFDPSKWEMTNLAKEVSTKGGADVTKTASGNPIEITDGSSAPLVKCVTAIQGNQDLHGYDKPWVGGAGKNKYTTKYEGRTNGGITFTVTDGVISIQGTAGSNNAWAVSDSNITSAQCINFPAGTYTLNATGIDYVRYYFRDFNAGTVLGYSSKSESFTVTLEEDTLIYVNARIGYGYSNNTDVRLNIQIESGSSETSYEPYSNICPITAYTEGEIEVRGKNLFDVSTAVSGYIDENGNVVTSANFMASDFMRVDGNTAYNLSFYRNATSGGSGMRIAWYDNDKVFIRRDGILEGTTVGLKSYSAVAPSNARYARVSMFSTDSSDFQFEKGETATDYEPYVGTTHTTTYPSAIYRGSEDVVGGKIQTNFPFMNDMSVGDWARLPAYASGTYYFRLAISGIKRGSAVGDVVPVICSCYRTVSGDDVYRHVGENGSIGVPHDNSIIMVRDDRFDNVNDFKTFLSGQSLAYPLATPTEESIEVTNEPIKSLSGYTHIESSTGDMEVEYITEEFQPLVDLIEESGGDSHTYSTTEQVVGKWVDGSDVYEKTYDIGYLTSNNKTIAHGISGFGHIIQVHGYVTNGTYDFHLPHVTTDAVSCVGVHVDSTNIYITSYDRSDYHGYVIIQYTKSTPTRSLNLTKSAVEEIPDEIKNAEYEEKPDVNEADDDAPTEVDER